MNIFKDMQEFGVSVENIIFAQLPFGTSNDLSRTFNWGATPSHKMKTDLEAL